MIVWLSLKREVSSHGVIPQARANLRQAGAKRDLRRVCGFERRASPQKSHCVFNLFFFFFLSVLMCNIFFFLVEMQL